MIGSTAESRQPQDLPLSISVVIPTYNRLEELHRCIASLLRQTRRPSQIIIVDDGQLDWQPLAQIVESAGVCFTYLPKEGPRGQARSRNLGVAQCTGDIIFFLDDDVVIDPRYIQAIVELYEADPEHTIGGVGGIIVNDEPIGLARAVAELLRGTPSWGHGRVFPSGVNQMNYHAVRDVQAVQWLGGGVSSFRREVMEEFKFCEEYGGYSLFEDVEHSYRVGQHYDLVITPEARLWHYPRSTAHAYNPEQFATKQIINLAYHFHNNMPQRLFNRVAFGWYLLTLLFTDVVRLISMPCRLTSNWMRLKGHLRGIAAYLMAKAGLTPT